MPTFLSPLRRGRRSSASLLTAVTLGLFVVSGSAVAAVQYSQGFETDTTDWSAQVTRVASGTNGITSAHGSFHAQATSGAFSRWGGYNSTFPALGYTTTVSVYLDTTAGFLNDTRFDFTSAINNPAGTHRRDFAFNAGFYDDSDATGSGPRFVFSASNNVGRGNSFPKNPGRDPFAVTASGWYQLEHRFYDNGSGILAVDLTLRNAAGAALHTWTLSDPTDVIGVTVGGNRYGWFPTIEMPNLAIDDAARTEPTAQPSSKDDCKDGGWQDLGRADGSTFKNQGDCIQYFNTGK